MAFIDCKCGFQDNPPKVKVSTKIVGGRRIYIVRCPKCGADNEMVRPGRRPIEPKR